MTEFLPFTLFGEKPTPETIDQWLSILRQEMALAQDRCRTRSGSSAASNLVQNSHFMWVVWPNGKYWASGRSVTANREPGVGIQLGLIETLTAGMKYSNDRAVKLASILLRNEEWPPSDQLLPRDLALIYAPEATMELARLSGLDREEMKRFVALPPPPSDTRRLVPAGWLRPSATDPSIPQFKIHLDDSHVLTASAWGCSCDIHNHPAVATLTMNTQPEACSQAITMFRDALLNVKYISILDDCDPVFRDDFNAAVAHTLGSQGWRSYKEWRLTPIPRKHV